MRDFRKLIAWQKAHALALCVHRTVRGMDARSAPGLRAQLLRAASSVPANLAEGSGKRSQGEFARYVDMALGSTREIENHLMLARDLGLLHPDAAALLVRDAEEVGRILYGLGRAVRSRHPAQDAARIDEGHEAGS